jgi:BlaI family penicillinase repressor
VERVRRVKNLEDTTIKTLLRRLIAKKAVDFTVDAKNAKLYHYFPTVTREDCVLKESKHFLSLYYKDDMSKLFATFVENVDISDEEIERLKCILEQKKGEQEG